MIAMQMLNAPIHMAVTHATAIRDMMGMVIYATVRIVVFISLDKCVSQLVPFTTLCLQSYSGVRIYIGNLRIDNNILI